MAKKVTYERDKLSVSDWCRREGVSRALAYKWIEQGRIPTVVVGDRQMIRVGIRRPKQLKYGELQAMTKEQRRAANAIAEDNRMDNIGSAIRKPDTQRSIAGEDAIMDRLRRNGLASN